MVDWERNWRGSGIFFVVLFIVSRITPDDAYLRFVSPILGLAWLAVVRGFLNMRSPSPVSTHGRAAVPAP